MAPLDREFEYRVNLSAVLPIALLVAAVATAFAISAYSNDRGLVLNGAPLSPTAATVFYWTAAAVFGLTAAALIYRGTVSQRIRVTSRGIVLPKSSWSAREVEIPYATISGIRELQESPPTLMIVHRKGLAKVHASRLPAMADYQTVRQALAEQMAAIEQQDAR